jgi:Tetracyclin repressor-like, C-terminal domain
MEMSEKIKNAYLEYVLENGKKPATFFAFAKKTKLKEAELYEYYTSFEAIEAELWASFFNEAVATAQGDAAYQNYSIREKLLAIYYTWAEVLKANRSFVVYSYHTFGQPLVKSRPQELKVWRESFLSFAKGIIMEGEESREIVSRKVISDRYPEGLWLNTIYLLDFWVKDTSRNFEMSDTAIEKTVNVIMNLMSRSIIDNVLDLAKFAYQNR